MTPPTTPPPTTEDIEVTTEEANKMAELLHDCYEMYSRDIGWQTQLSTRTGFENLPQKNKKVMKKMGNLVVAMIKQQRAFQKQEDEKEIQKLIDQKRMIIEKEGYPATDVIAVLRKEIHQEYKEELHQLKQEKAAQARHILTELEDWLALCAVCKGAHGEWTTKEDVKKRIDELKEKYLGAHKDSDGG